MKKAITNPLIQFFLFLALGLSANISCQKAPGKGAKGSGHGIDPGAFTLGESDEDNESMFDGAGTETTKISADDLSDLLEDMPKDLKLSLERMKLWFADPAESGVENLTDEDTELYGLLEVLSYAGGHSEVPLNQLNNGKIVLKTGTASECEIPIESEKIAWAKGDRNNGTICVAEDRLAALPKATVESELIPALKHELAHLYGYFHAELGDENDNGTPNETRDENVLTGIQNFLVKYNSLHSIHKTDKKLIDETFSFGFDQWVPSYVPYQRARGLDIPAAGESASEVCEKLAQLEKLFFRFSHRLNSESFVIPENLINLYHEIKFKLKDPISNKGLKPSICSMSRIPYRDFEVLKDYSKQITTLRDLLNSYIHRPSELTDLSEKVESTEEVLNRLEIEPINI